MYNRFDKGMHPKQRVLDHLLSCMSQKMKLEDNASELENVSPDSCQCLKSPAGFGLSVVLGLSTGTQQMVPRAGLNDVAVIKRCDFPQILICWVWSRSVAGLLC